MGKKLFKFLVTNSQFPLSKSMYVLLWSSSFLSLLLLPKYSGSEHSGLWKTTGFSCIRPAAALISQANQKADAECGLWERKSFICRYLASGRPTSQLTARTLFKLEPCFPMNHLPTSPGRPQDCRHPRMNSQPESSIAQPQWESQRPNTTFFHKSSANMALRSKLAGAHSPAVNELNV